MFRSRCGVFQLRRFGGPSAGEIGADEINENIAPVGAISTGSPDSDTQSDAGAPATGH